MSLVALTAAAFLAQSASSAAVAPPTPDDATKPPPLSVYRPKLVVDVPVLGLSLLGLAVPYTVAGDLVYPRCPCDVRELSAIDRWSLGLHSHVADTIANAGVGLAVVLPAALDLYWVGANNVFLEDLLVYSEALLLSGALVSWTKASVGRPLPVVYAGLSPELEASPAGYRSFYSGHTAITATALTVMVLTLRFRAGDVDWGYAAALGGTALVAAAKIAAGQHFLSDTVIGALMGTVVGVAIPAIHRRLGPGHLVPSVSADTAGLVYAGTF